jgi:thiamine-phosphate pyrophosphorylase
VLFYYITDRMQFPGTAAEQRRGLLDKIAEAARAGIDYIQLREKDLSARELELLARDAVSLLTNATRDSRRATRLFINSRTDLALACGADGVHLTSTDISPADARAVASRSGRNDFLIAASCHSAQEVRLAESNGADFVVLAPIFGKATTGTPGIGLQSFRDLAHVPPGNRKTEAEEARTTIPVLALGGITIKNAKSCIDAGAAGIAGIRLFQENDVEQVVTSLRAY